MLTSYLVRCPQSECHWFGSLIPQRVEGKKGEVSFQCPKCRHEWRGRIVGEDVRIIRERAVAVTA